MNEPYSFFLMNWDVEQTAFALDANGGQGSIDRLLLNCSEANKNNIDELFALIDQVYGQSSTTASVEPSPMVARPAAQRAVKAGNLTQLNFIPAFRAR